MSKQTEALRLINNRQNAHLLSWQANACAELRRLHAINGELLAFVQEWLDRQGTDENHMVAKARAAIAKATGDQK